MELTLIALRQTLVMFLFMMTGYLLYKGKKITGEGSRSLANILLYVILPCAIINAFCSGYTPEKSVKLLYAFLVGALPLGIAMLVSFVIFRKRPVDNFGAAFSNAGFMGIPMIQAVLGTGAVIYAAPFIALLNFLQWTYGAWVLTGKTDHLSPKKVLTNPILLSLVLGLIIFYGRITLPQVVGTAVSSVAGMNSPVAMMILGVYLAQTDIGSLFTSGHLYANTAVRLVLIPLLTLAILYLLPDALQEAKTALLIVAAAPVGSNVAVYAQLYKKDYSYASKSVCLSTLFSILTMPLLIWLAGYLGM